MLGLDQFFTAKNARIVSPLPLDSLQPLSFKIFQDFLLCIFNLRLIRSHPYPSIYFEYPLFCLVCNSVHEFSSKARNYWIKVWKKPLNTYEGWKGPIF